MSDSIRIKADLTANNANLSINLPQSFDFLEVLSLKFTSDEVYKLHNANYGVLVGRVSTNGGFGIPNAKVSVFIPITDEDNDNVFLKEYYNFKTPFDKDKEGVRYNLLPKEKQNKCHVPIGTFPNKNELLDNDVWIEVYEKYYKYNAITNGSGDYMIVGVPIGNQQVHMDVDLSDIGFVSLRPYDLIAQGSSPNYFDSNNRFKFSKDLDTLPHIQSANQAVEVIPFWGDVLTNTVGITQLNFNLPVNLTPHAVFFGSIFTDTDGKSVTKKCKPSNEMGDNCSLKPSAGNIEMIRKVSDYIDGLEYYPLNAPVDNEGNFNVLVPMNLNKVITTENGDIVASQDPNVGVPTRTRARFRINSENFNYSFFKGTTRSGSFLVPNLYNDFEFGVDTKDKDLFELEWKKLYTVSQYIPRYSKKADEDDNNFIGIKDVKICDGTYSFPYNRIYTLSLLNFNSLFLISRFSLAFPFAFLFVFLNLFITIISTVAKIINKIAGLVGLTPIKLPCNGEDLEPEPWEDCIRNLLLEALGLVKYQFYNDWVSGALYAPRFSYKVKFKNGQKEWERYCDYDCRPKNQAPSNKINDKNRCYNSSIMENKEFKPTDGGKIKTVDKGFIYKYDEFYYYIARNDVNPNNPSAPALFPEDKSALMFATNLMELGSSVSCDVDGKPYIIKQLSPSTFTENNEGDILFNVESLSFGKYNRNAIQLMNQIAVEQYSPFYGYQLSGSFENLPEYDTNTGGKTEAVAFSRTDTALREYLCKNWKYFGNNFIYDSYVNNASSSSYFKEVDDDDPNTIEEVADFFYDLCRECTSNSEPYKRIHPYYFYFGTSKGKNAYDTLMKNYFNDCD